MKPGPQLQQTHLLQELAALREQVLPSMGEHLRRSPLDPRDELPLVESPKPPEEEGQPEPAEATTPRTTTPATKIVVS